MRAEFLGPDSPRWAEALAGTDHDFYHLPGYAALSARHEGGEPLAFLAEDGDDRLLVPLILRHAGGGWSDATCPYGYSGPVLRRGPSATSGDFLALAVGALIEGLSHRQVICLFSRLNPLIDLPMGPLRDAGVVVRHGSTVPIDLTRPDEELWRQTRPSYRHEIRRAERRGQVVRVDPTWGAFDAFLDIYAETMQRRGAARSYLFPREHFLGLRAVLGDRLHLGVTEVDGAVVSAALFTEYGGVVNYHLSGTRAAFVRHGPTKPLLHAVRAWAKGRGNRVLHLGGGLGGAEDSLFDFKAGFSDLRSPFSTWRVVTDEPAYRELTRRWESRARTDPDGPDGFFPAYRKPTDDPPVPIATTAGMSPPSGTGLGHP